MKPCRHPQWLSLYSKDHQNALFDSGRLRALVREVENPYSVAPSLFLFIGDRSKSATLEKLFLIQKRKIFSRSRSIGDIDLHLTDTLDSSERPTLIADICLSSKRPRRKPVRHICCEPKKWPLQDTLGSLDMRGLKNIDRFVLGRLLLPFTDVICFFASDIGGFQKVVRDITIFLQTDSASASSFGKPVVIVITDKIPLTEQREKEAKKALLWLLEEETHSNPFDIISALEVFAMPPRYKQCSDTRFRRLKDRLRVVSTAVRKQREGMLTLFSLGHFEAFFGVACHQFCEMSGEPFNFIRASRLHNPPALELKKHLGNFLGQCTTPHDLLDFAGQMVASSILLDSYPPGCHGKLSHRFATKEKYVLVDVASF